MTEPLSIWVVAPLLPPAVAALEAHYRVLFTPDDPWRRGLQEAAAMQVQAVVTNGAVGIPEECLAHLPQVRLITCFGAGHEGLPVQAARARGIALAHAPGTNTETVADHAIGLLLAAGRGFLQADASIRAGKWSAARVPRPTLTGSRLGLIGLGLIGSAIARRAAAFPLTIAYHARRPRPEVAWSYHADPVALAENSDFLIVACPGGAATRKLVNARVLAALGKDGFLVNVARGSVVDTDALIHALRAGTIAGAALDVVDGEPDLPPALFDCPNLLLTPHMAGRSPAAQASQVNALLDNLDNGLNGRPLAHPVPG